MAGGTERVRDAVRAGRARFVVVAADLTATGRDKLIPLLQYSGVRYTVRYERAELGGAVGRGPLAAIGLTHEGFAGRLETLFEESDGVD